MAAFLNSAAASTTNKGKSSAYYGATTGKDKNNPVFQALNSEIKIIYNHIRKRSDTKYIKPDNESCSRCSDIIFELWNRYEPKLQKNVYYKKLLEMGDTLLSMKEYKLALWQCYERYLLKFDCGNFVDISEGRELEEIFFPDGFETEESGFTFRALMGKSISLYQLIKENDDKLQNKQSVDYCLQILSFLRLLMQVILPKERLCWLIYNGSIHIYTISRHLMSLGHSAQVLEYVIWASVCMETSIPLISVKYLTWRSTLYTAVCQCYYDCKSPQHAEAFARRGLAKINELNQLERMSNSVQSPQSTVAFRQATIKMAIMMFKRSVFETRRKPKGLLRPKTRANYKDVVNGGWPRTLTEKLMNEMFEGSAAQFLALIESLTDSNRRIILTGPPAHDNEPEILDVYVELFMAGQELLAGGGGLKPSGPKAQTVIGMPPLAGVTEFTSLMESAVSGIDGIPIHSVIKFMKLAFNYEYWDLFDNLVEPVRDYLNITNVPNFQWYEKLLELLLAMEKLSHSKKQSKKKETGNEEVPEDEQPTLNPTVASAPGTSMKSTSMNDDHINLADILLSIISGTFQKKDIEIDIIIDSALILWNKCKTVFHKYQTGSVDNPRYIQKMDQPYKWMYLLDTVHQTLCWCGISSVDPSLMAEVVIRLAMLYESSAYLDTSDGGRLRRESVSEGKSSSEPSSVFTKIIKEKSGMKDSKTTLTDIGLTEINHSRISMMSSPANLTAKRQLEQAKSILELGLKDISYARQAVALNDGKAIADVCWVKSVLNDTSTLLPGELNPEVFVHQMHREVTEVDEDGDDLVPDAMKELPTTVWNTVKDLHLELILMYHRVCLKLATLKQLDSASKPKSKPKEKENKEDAQMDSNKSLKAAEDYENILNFEDLTNQCKKNNLCKALLFMESALLSTSGVSYNGKQKKLLEEALTLVQKAQLDEKRTFLENRTYPEDVKPTKVPPPPILLSRTDTTMVFKPATFIPVNGEKVAWFRIYARNSTGSNVKVRLNDYHLPGTGNQVPVGHDVITISGLIPNERYVFAVAAHDGLGKMIGGIGETSKPILASHPLPILMTYAFLAQISYQVGCYEVTRRAFDVLWEHFIMEKPPPSGVTHITPIKNDFKLTLHKLNQRAICLASPVLLRQFLSSIFVNCDISIREGELFCDVVSNRGPMFNNQVSRMLECEKLIVAIELAGWLNEANLALQGVIQCYGLLAPLLYHKIPSQNVIKILQRTHCVLQEIPAGLILKRQGHIADSLHHMTACITYQMARSLRTWGQKTLANNINEAGRKLLSIEGLDKDKQQQDAGDKSAEPSESMILDSNVDPGMITLQALKKKRKGRNGPVTSKDDMDGIVNEELKALEAHILRMTRTSQNEMELSGNEDPNILHAYIAFLPAKMAFKEVQKFKRRARYLEFIVQVAQKGLIEGLSEQVIDWCEDCVSWLNKRNEQIIGPRAFMSKQPGAITVSGDDPKKFAAAMVEYTKDKDAAHNKSNKSPAAKASTTHVTPKPRRKKYRPFKNYSHMPDTVRQAQEEKESKAIEALGLYFSDMYRTAVKKRRLRKINTEELPWKSQMKIVLGLSCFQSFLQKLEKREKLMGTASSNMYKTSYLDPEWFTFETAGTLVVGWDGGPARQPSRPDILEQDDDQQPLDLAMAGGKRKPTVIEIAAAAVIVGPIAPTQRGGLVQQSLEFDDTPRTYRSDISTIQETAPLRSMKNKEDDISLLTTQATIQSLNKTFTYLKQSLILAHRGQHWTLLQNACNSLWNCAHTALLRASTTNQGPVETGLFTVETLRALVWKPFYQSADCLLDMMYKLQIDLDQQSTKAKSKSKVQGEYFENWYGNVKNEKGGASLKFEQPLDDRSAVDVRWIRRYILRVIEMLYYEQKWEKLVDIALRFNALSNYRYAEQVIPLMVQAQRKLEVIVEQAGGPQPPQKHFQMVLKQLDGVLSAKDYLQCQLKIQVDRRDLKPVEPGAHIDPLGHNVYSEQDAKKLICVPLDYNYSLDTLRQVLDQSRYAARALRHSRKMLVLYLAGQQNNNEDPMMPKSQSKVDFLPNTAHPEPTVPTELMKEEFLSTDDIQTSPIPRSQLSSVIESYQKTIDSLMAKNQRGLGAQAMFELGNLYYHTNNIRCTFKWWCEGLDVILNLTDALHTWKSALADDNDISRELLSRCGLWGCLLGGIITSNIAQYILTSDLGLKLECCFLSGYFFKALFRASLPHPTSDRDYALYDIGEGCEVTSLVPGIDLLSDRFRADGRQVVAALRWVTEELSRGRHNLFVLPLLTLNQYFTTFVCRDLQRSVDCRILKIRVLTDLKFFTEAFTVLRRVLHGERLPQIGDSGFRHVESKVGNLQFNTSKPIMETNNLKVLETVIDKRLPGNLATMYGPHLTCHLLLVQSHLLVTVADTLPVIPALTDAVQLEKQFIVIKARATNTSSHVGMGTRAPRLVSATSQNIGTDDIRDQDYVDEEMYCFNRRFTECKKTLTLEIIKATLLNTAEQMVTTLSDNLTENNQQDKNVLEGLTGAELELVILCKLQQSAISRQKHHATLAARIAFSTLKLLQDSNLFKSKQEVKNKPRPSSLKGHGNKKNAPVPDIKLNKPNNSQFEYHDFQSLSRLDIRLWLKCRLELVQCLMMELKGMGDIKGNENKFVSEIGDCRQYCVEGVGESDMIGDVELQAEFFLLGAYINIMEGKNIDHTISLLKEAKDNLLKCVRRSDKGEELWIQCLMLMTDLCVLSNIGEKENNTQQCLENYIEIHNLTLDQLEKLGERIERYRNEKDKQFSTPVTPMNNVYIPHLLFLTQLKLRIGHSLAQNAAVRSSKGLSDTEAVYLWLDSMGVLVSALDISRFSINRDTSLETEILYDLGRVQKMLVFLDKFPARRAANTLLDAIKISYGTDHNLSLIRQAYLEIGQIYLYSSSLPLNKEGTSDAIGDSGDESNVSTPAPPSSKPPSSSQSKRKWKPSQILEEECLTEETTNPNSPTLTNNTESLATENLNQTSLDSDTFEISVNVESQVEERPVSTPVQGDQTPLLSNQNTPNNQSPEVDQLNLSADKPESSPVTPVLPGSDVASPVPVDESPISRDASPSQNLAQQDSPSPKPLVPKKRGKKERSKSKQSKDEDYIGDSEKEKQAAWLAMRCAAATGQALRARLLLKGNPEVTQKLPERAVKEIPDFLALDLMGSYVLGQKRKVFKSEIEEELSTMKEADEVRHYDTYDEQIMKCKVAAEDISWIQVLGYQSILHRLVSTKTMTSFSVPTVESQTTLGSGTVGSEFDLGFISHTNSCSAANNIIKYMLCSGPWIARLNNLHYYLSTNLSSYAAECCAVYPPPGLNLPVPQTLSEAAPTQKSYSSGMSSEMDHESIMSGSLDLILMAPPGFKKDSYKPADKGLVLPEDNEICLQWYHPTMEETDPSQPDSQDIKIKLLYSIYKKNVAANYIPGYKWVSLVQLTDLHDRLSMLSQRGEISLADKQKKEKEKEPVVATPSQTKNKKVTRIKALSPKIQRDEQLEGLLYQCLDDCATLLNSQTDQDALEIPFEVTKPNLKNLEAVFDPSLGLTLRNGDLLTWLLKLFPTSNQ